MFSFLLSEQGKMRRNAANWLEVADRVHKFRRDQLTDTQNQRLVAAAGEVRLRLKERADASRLKMAIEQLESVLRDTGGRIYPVSSMVENVEFFLVAAIVILGIRAYFVQPFKIPTNSMWPSYYGVTHQTYRPGETPNAAKQAWRFLTLGGWNYRVDAPADGELMLGVFEDGQLAQSQVPGRKFGVLPTIKRKFYFSVGGEVATLTIPGSGASTEDFQLERVIEDLLAPDKVAHRPFPALSRLLLRQRRAALKTSIETVRNGRQYVEKRIFWVPTGIPVKRGEPMISFDLLTGDLLFVDRITYNFIRPEVGQGFVFHTRKIPGIGSDQYYIKRLVGVPGDTLEIREPVLYRNGQPVRGSEAFDANARQLGFYRGYVNELPGGSRYLNAGETLSVPEDSFFAMGDNSIESSDSRVWGFVPGKEVVGRPLFIYFPFSRRWGLPD
ncbi:MAG TPA: signal peptidase I [Opitutaceae bacterium]|nr:signal peptidase I [Opitutaceae bacterium]